MVSVLNGVHIEVKALPSPLLSSPVVIPSPHIRNATLLRLEIHAHLFLQVIVLMAIVVSLFIWTVQRRMMLSPEPLLSPLLLSSAILQHHSRCRSVSRLFIHLEIILHQLLYLHPCHPCKHGSIIMLQVLFLHLYQAFLCLYHVIRCAS